MAKPKYNQGDIVQFTHPESAKKDLLVIIEVFEGVTGLRYLIRWLADNAKGRCKINTLDDEPAVRLVARG